MGSISFGTIFGVLVVAVSLSLFLIMNINHNIIIITDVIYFYHLLFLCITPFYHYCKHNSKYYRSW